MNRRNFINNATAATTGLMLASLDGFASPQRNNNLHANFQLKILATSWGFEGTTDAYCAKAKKEGYDGIETWWPMKEEEQHEMFAALKKYNLEVGFLTAGSENNFDEHFISFKNMINAASANKIQKPLYINCHSGRDYFKYEQGKAFVDYTTGLSKSTGIKILHETHRSRLMYAAPVARNYLETIPALRFTLDISHWCNVHESLLADQQETIDLVLPRVDHIHARIGHPEGPQVNDPRAPEWEKAVTAHFAWWDKVIEMKKQQGETMTILTEFGPPDYMQTIPYTRQPVADQWAINVHMMHTLRKRYQS